jgi:hypothetical protein
MSDKKTTMSEREGGREREREGGGENEEVRAEVGNVRK